MLFVCLLAFVCELLGEYRYCFWMDGSGGFAGCYGGVSRLGGKIVVRGKHC